MLKLKFRRWSKDIPYLERISSCLFLSAEWVMSCLSDNLAYASFFSLFYRVPAKEVTKIGKALNFHEDIFCSFFSSNSGKLLIHEILSGVLSQGLPAMVRHP
jgi:hypothetical protein